MTLQKSLINFSISVPSKTLKFLKTGCSVIPRAHTLAWPISKPTWRQQFYYSLPAKHEKSVTLMGIFPVSGRGQVVGFSQPLQTPRHTVRRHGLGEDAADDLHHRLRSLLQGKEAQGKAAEIPVKRMLLARALSGSFQGRCFSRGRFISKNHKGIENFWKKEEDSKIKEE